MKEINVTVYGFVSFPFFHIRDRFEKLKKDNVRRKVEPVQSSDSNYQNDSNRGSNRRLSIYI